MKMSSTIKNKWRFCTFASFISCFILLSVLNQGHDSEKLSHVQNITLSTTSSNDSAHQPAASAQILKPSNIGEHEKETNEKEHGSNLSHHPTASMKFSEEPSNTREHEKGSNEEEHICNILDGKWTYNPTASPLYNWSQCPFLSDQVSCQRNGRSDFEYESWSWEAKGCEIPK